MFLIEYLGLQYPTSYFWLGRKPLVLPFNTFNTNFSPNMMTLHFSSLI